MAPPRPRMARACSRAAEGMIAVAARRVPHGGVRVGALASLLWGTTASRSSLRSTRCSSPPTSARRSPRLRASPRWPGRDLRSGARAGQPPVRGHGPPRKLGPAARAGARAPRAAGARRARRARGACPRGNLEPLRSGEVDAPFEALDQATPERAFDGARERRPRDRALGRSGRARGGHRGPRAVSARRRLLPDREPLPIRDRSAPRRGAPRGRSRGGGPGASRRRWTVRWR